VFVDAMLNIVSRIYVELFLESMLRRVCRIYF